MKHALLLWLLRALSKKPAPFFVLDTHAGAGRYDLQIGPAQRTGEFRTGILRLLDDPPAALSDYITLIQSVGLYPGSPVLIRAVLRPEDRLACCELQADEHAALAKVFARDRQVAVHHRDGYEALGALLPPTSQRRGLVLIDPPYEQPDEFSRVAGGLHRAYIRFGTGVLAAWYPIKHRAPVRTFLEAVRETGMRDVVAAELWLREPVDPARLNGCGLLVVRPPYRFEEEAAGTLAALLDRLGAREAGEGTAVLRLVPETT